MYLDCVNSAKQSRVTFRFSDHLFFCRPSLMMCRVIYIPCRVALGDRFGPWLTHVTDGARDSDLSHARKKSQAHTQSIIQDHVAV